MFNGAQNFVVEGGSFVATVDAPKKVDIDRLLNMVAPNAILNAGGRADEVRCFPGTRKEVIGKVEEWMSGVMDGSCKNRIMWLSGPAGSGKSAICQTVVERCSTRRQHAASFFFFRGDHTRNRAQPLVPTLVYQLRDIYPMIDEILTNCLKTHPLICNASIVDQFLHLIASPRQAAQEPLSAGETIVLVIDGLDECDDTRKQDQILTALRALANADDSPFLVLIASRAEPHLIMSFNRLGTSMESIILDDKYNPRNDIRLFVAAKFDEIKQLHHLRHMLSEDWPAQSDIDAITNKSSGQFIYAATVMRFIQYSPESPNLSLVTILKMQPSAGRNPFAQLDEVYSHIFSKVHDIRSVKLILSACLLADLDEGYPEPRHQNILRLLGYRPFEIKSFFANLGAIILVNTDPVKLVFYHASLHDYLKYKWRSGEYNLDGELFPAEVSTICLQNFHDLSSLDLAIRPLNYVKKATAELSKSLSGASKRSLADREEYESISQWTLLMCTIEDLYLQTDRELFKTLLQGWVRFAYINNIESHMEVDMESLFASWYYKWYDFTEGCKFALQCRDPGSYDTVPQNEFPLLER